MKIAVIGVGLAGTNIAIAISKAFGDDCEVGVINLSSQEVKAAETEVSPGRCLCIGTDEINGSGKDRAVGYDRFKETLPQIKELAKDLCEDKDFAFVCHSTGGGTGSSMSHALTTLMCSKSFQESIPGDKKPIVFGLAALPDFNEGTKTFLNTIDSLNDINKAIDREVARYILVRNDFSKATEDQKYRIINNKVAEMLYRYMCEFGSSRRGCLDKSDRINALKIMGLHSFMEVNTDGKFISPFLTHDGTRMKFVSAEIPEDSENALNAKIRALSADDSKIGFFSETDISPIVHIAGFAAIRKISETYSNYYHSMKTRVEESAKNDLKYGTGLEGIEEDKAWAAEEYADKGLESEDEVMNLFDK